VQVKLHVAPEHVGDPFVTVGHAVHEPQWAGSVCSFTQKPLQSENEL
jgi:hypothetical protein